MTTNTEEHPERLDPREHRGDLIDTEHRARYLWAAQLTASRSVLDAGCGAGYGLKLLAEGGASRVVGIDLSDVAIGQAAQAVASEQIEVLQGDVRNLPFSDGEFGMVACFEVIEHIEDPETALDEMARVLAPNGLLCISTPNRCVYPPGNPHHVHEYEPEEFVDTLRRRFPHVTLYRQTAWLASAIFSDQELSATGASGVPTANVTKTASRQPGQEIFTVAVAGYSPVPSVSSLLALGEPFEVSWWETRIDEIESRLQQHESQLKQGRAMQVEAERNRDDYAAALLDLEADLARAQGEASQLRAGRAEFEEWAKKAVARATKRMAQERTDREDFQNRLRHAERTIDDIKTSISWRVTSPLRYLKRISR